MFLTWFQLTHSLNTASCNRMQLGLDAGLDLSLQRVPQLCKAEEDLTTLTSRKVWDEVCSIRSLGILRFSLVAYRNMGTEPVVTF